MKYYVIPAKAAEELHVTEFRQGSQQKGYVVTAGDLCCASEEVRDSAEELTEAQALKFIKEL